MVSSFAPMELLSENEITAQLEQSKWTREGEEIVLDREMKDFAAAIAWVNRVAEAAQAADHHPDILIHGWNQVRLRLTTHSANGLTQNDFALARAIENL